MLLPLREVDWVIISVGNFNLLKHVSKTSYALPRALKHYTAYIALVSGLGCVTEETWLANVIEKKLVNC